MTTFNEQGNIITSFDLTKGYVYPTKTKTGTQSVVLPGTESMNDGKGLLSEVTVYEDAQIYHAYTDSELAAINAPTLEERVAAVEASLLSIVTGGTTL